MPRLVREFPGRPDRARRVARQQRGAFVAPFGVQWAPPEVPPPLGSHIDLARRTLTISGGVPTYHLLGTKQSVTMEGHADVAYPVVTGQTVTVIDLANQLLEVPIPPFTIIGQAFMRYVGDLDKPPYVVGYRSTPDIVCNDYVAPAGGARVRLTVGLCAERHPFNGGTLVLGTIMAGGNPVFPDWDRYVCDWTRADGTLVQRFNLNWSASPRLNCPAVQVSACVFDVAAGDRLHFWFSERDDKSGYAIDRLTATAFGMLEGGSTQAGPVYNSGIRIGWEAGCVVRVTEVADPVTYVPVHP